MSPRSLFISRSTAVSLSGEFSFEDFETMARGGEKTQKQVQFLCPEMNHLFVEHGSLFHSTELENCPRLQLVLCFQLLIEEDDPRTFAPNADSELYPKKGKGLNPPPTFEILLSNS